MEFNLSRHPIYWITKVVKNSLPPLYQSVDLCFSYYRYTPRSYLDDRVEFTVPIEAVNESYLLNLLDKLDSDQELAFHSKVILGGGKIMHLPMIDLGLRKFDKSAISALNKFQSYNKNIFALFDSGRSFHLYGSHLLEEKQWSNFMGELLLLNEPSGQKLIDTRWIGHRLIAGYSALRLSCNTSHYKAFPTFLGYLEEVTNQGTSIDSIVPLKSRKRARGPSF